MIYTFFNKRNLNLFLKSPGASILSGTIWHVGLIASKSLSFLYVNRDSMNEYMTFFLKYWKKNKYIL